MTLTMLERTVLEYLGHGPKTIECLLDLLPLSSRQVVWALSELKKQGIVSECEKGWSISKIPPMQKPDILIEAGHMAEVMIEIGLIRSKGLRLKKLFLNPKEVKILHSLWDQVDRFIAGVEHNDPKERERFILFYSDASEKDILNQGLLGKLAHT